MSNNRLQSLTLLAIEAMNKGLNPTSFNFEKPVFEVRVVPPVGFGISYGDILFCSDADLVEPKAEDLMTAYQDVQEQILFIWRNNVQIPIAKINTRYAHLSKNPEAWELIDGVIDFAFAMQERLWQKAQEGVKGWKKYDRNTVVQEIYKRLHRYNEGEDKVDIGIANFALISYMNRNGSSELTLADEFEESVQEPGIFTFKEKQYKLLFESKVKLEGILFAMGEIIGRGFLTQEQFEQLKHKWIPIKVYKCLYDNVDGLYWARETDEFDRKFITDGTLNEVEDQSSAELKSQSQDIATTTMEKVASETSQELQQESRVELEDDEEDEEEPSIGSGANRIDESTFTQSKDELS